MTNASTPEDRRRGIVLAALMLIFVLVGVGLFVGMMWITMRGG